jgi:hypothetical protein
MKRSPRPEASSTTTGAAGCAMAGGASGRADRLH